MPVSPGVPRDKRDRWGRLAVHRRSYKGADGTNTAELELRVLTFPARGFTQRRLGSAPREEQYARPSAVMDLGEAVQTAVDAGLPLLLSTEAAGQLKDTVRVGRMKGRPGMLTITTSDGVSATTRRLVAEQAIGELRALKRARGEGDAGGRRAAGGADDARAAAGRRPGAARPPARDGRAEGRRLRRRRVGGRHRQDDQLRPGARAPRHRRSRDSAGSSSRRAGCSGSGARSSPRARPAGGCHRWRRTSSCSCSPTTGRSPGRSGASTASSATGRAWCSPPNSVLDRYPADLQAIPWHLLIADEALRYANPATEAHQALAQVRFGSVADCWLLTATPRGKSAEHLDVLVGLAVGDKAMITERLNTREAGDLMDEINAHRLRVNYGPHLVRVTRRDMQAWMPEVRPAQPLALDPDPALAELLDAIRHGGREAYRRLLEVLRELKTLEAGSELYRQALAELARAQGIVLGNVGVFVDASVDPETLTHSKAALATALVRQGLVAEAIRGGGDGLPLLRGVTAQTLAGVAGEEQVIVFGERVWCLRQLARTLRERHGVEAHVADGSITTQRVRGAQAALHRRRVPGAVPVADRARGPQPPERLGALPPRPAVAADRPRAARRPGGQARRGPRARADLHPVHPARRDRARRLRARRARRRAPPDPRQLRGRPRRREHRRDPARRDHRPGRRQQGRRRLRRDRRPAAGRGQRVRQLNHHDYDWRLITCSYFAHFRLH